MGSNYWGDIYPPSPPASAPLAMSAHLNETQLMMCGENNNLNQ